MSSENSRSSTPSELSSNPATLGSEARMSDLDNSPATSPGEQPLNRSNLSLSPHRYSDTNLRSNLPIVGDSPSATEATNSPSEGPSTSSQLQVTSPPNTNKVGQSAASSSQQPVSSNSVPALSVEESERARSAPQFPEIGLSPSLQRRNANPDNPEEDGSQSSTDEDKH